MENVKSCNFYACLGTNKHLLAACELRECGRGIETGSSEVEKGALLPNRSPATGHLWAIAYWAHFLALKRAILVQLNAGFLGEHISCQGVGSCPRSAANLAEFTNATFPLQVLAVTQRDKKRRVPVELGK